MAFNPKKILDYYRSQGRSTSEILSTLEKLRTNGDISEEQHRVVSAWLVNPEDAGAAKAFLETVKREPVLQNLLPSGSGETPKKEFPAWGPLDGTKKRGRRPSPSSGKPILAPGRTGSERSLEDALSSMVGTSPSAPLGAEPAGPTAEFLRRFAGPDVVRQRTPIDPEEIRRLKSEGRLGSLLKSAGVEGAGTGLQKGTARLAQKLGMEGALLGGGGRIGKVLGGVGKFVIRNPKLAAIDAIGFGLPLLGVAKDAVNWGSRQVTGDPLIGRELTVEQSLEMEKKVRMEQMRLQIQQQERAKVLTANTVNLLQYAPDVARQVMAGRRLPKGAVVIGGAPRVDLMQEVAGQMADGAYQEQDPLTQLTGMMR